MAALGSLWFIATMAFRRNLEDLGWHTWCRTSPALPVCAHDAEMTGLTG